MKTKMVALAAILLAGSSAVSFAANDNNTVAPDSKECKYKQNKDNKRCPAFNPFEGLNLSADQQAKIEALRPQGKCDGTQKQKCDNKSDKCPLDRATKVDRRQAKRDYLAKVKAILTPEQYVSFLENLAVSGHNRANGNFRHHKDGKRHQGEKRAQKPAEQRK